MSGCCSRGSTFPARRSLHIENRGIHISVYHKCNNGLHCQGNNSVGNPPQTIQRNQVCGNAHTSAVAVQSGSVSYTLSFVLSQSAGNTLRHSHSNSFPLNSPIMPSIKIGDKSMSHIQPIAKHTALRYFFFILSYHLGFP